MFSSSIKFLKYCLLLVIVGVTPLNAAELIKRAEGNSVYCNSYKDYESTKVGAHRIAKPKVLLKDQKNLVINVTVDAAKCEKIGDNVYLWKRISPNDDIEYDHSYNDLDSGELVTRTVKAEYKKVWLEAINNTYKIVGSSKIRGSVKTGFSANIPIDISKVFTSEQLSLINKGESVKGRIQLSLKAIRRHVSNEIKTSYREIRNGGIYYVIINMRREKGKLYLI